MTPRHTDATKFSRASQRGKQQRDGCKIEPAVTQKETIVSGALRSSSIPRSIDQRLIEEGCQEAVDLRMLRGGEILTPRDRPIYIPVDQRRQCLILRLGNIEPEEYGLEGTDKCQMECEPYGPYVGEDGPGCLWHRNECEWCWFLRRPLIKA